MRPHIILLELNGRLDADVHLRLELPEMNQSGTRVWKGTLSDCRTLQQALQDWQQAYDKLTPNGHASRLGSDRAVPTNIGRDRTLAIQHCQTASERLCQEFNTWLVQRWISEAADTTTLENILLANLPQDPNCEVRILLQTSDRELRALPWQAWNFLTTHPTKPEVAFWTGNWKPPKPCHRKQRQVRILVILGDAGDGSTQDIIQIQVDAALLQQLPKAETELVCRSNPLPQEFCDLLQDERGWDIFFFAGHSATQPDGSGVFYLQHPEQPDQRLGLSFDRFQQSMRKALEQGLQLVILNSCQGWGVIRPLENLQVPQAIIMREAVPDPVAQAFLQRFLQAYSVAGKSLYQAVRSAREKLEGLEVEYPNATWLPVIYQNPAATAPTWKDLCRKPLVSLSQVLLISAAIAIGVTGIRHLGWLQRSEFWAFDRLMQLRPREKQDKRLLIITINKEDIEYQKSKGMELGKAESSYGQSLSDQALEELLFKKLKPHHPAAIGLDIYRDFEVEPKYPRLKAELRQNKHLVVVCGNASDNESLATLPPPEANKDQIGFSDLPLDIDHGVRRQIINAEPDPPHCPTTKSFSFQLAHQYLSAKNIKVFDEPGADQIQIGSVQLKKLVNHDATYHPLDAGTDFMVPLNYRMTEQISPIISLRDLLERANNDQLADLVKNNIVLIGKIDNQDDLHLTSFSSGKVAGVFIHAHMISQLLSAVLDDRPLLWYWPKWGDFLWIWSWAFGSGVIIVFLSRKYPIMITTLTLSSCFGSCFFLLLQAGWVPCIPTGLAILLTNFSLSVVKNSLVRRINK